MIDEEQAEAARKERAEQEELGRAEAAMRADDELRARNFMPGLIGEEFGVDASSDRLKHEYLKELGKWYETFFAAKHEQDIDFVRYNPGESPEVEIHFRDGSELKDAGDKLLLSGKATPQKADLMVQIAVAKGLTEVRLRGTKEFKRDLAKSCFEHGVAVLNPEMRKYMADLAVAMPERAGMYRDTATTLPPAPPVPTAVASAKDSASAMGDIEEWQRLRDQSPAAASKIAARIVAAIEEEQQDGRSGPYTYEAEAIPSEWEAILLSASTYVDPATLSAAVTAGRPPEQAQAEEDSSSAMSM